MRNVSIKQTQLDWLDWEFGVFFHFGIRTFNEGHRDWDMQEMKLASFNPSQLSCRQWIETIQKAGARYAVLVCKHHDGFANWPSQYTDYSVAGTPWKDGKGDVVREYVDACRAFGIKVGLYYSPAEFGSQDKNAQEYDDYFINQITELLTGYGRIDYLWFDGNGSKDHKYDAVRITSEIRRLQPEILLFNMWDADTRWCGNEAGFAHAPNPYIVNASDVHTYLDAPIDPVTPRFLPVECDFRMRLGNWFYSDHDEDTVKSVQELMGIYDYSVGRGANFLINIGPNRDGLLPEKDAARLIEFGDALRSRFANPVPATFAQEEGGYTLQWDEPVLIDTIVLQETLSAQQATQAFHIECFPYMHGDPIVVHYGKTIGHKYICRIPPFYTVKVRIVAEAGVMDLKSAQVFPV